ncbi:hypothetical protein A6R68_15677, partial [Neotoma lepida]
LHYQQVAIALPGCVIQIFYLTFGVNSCFLLIAMGNILLFLVAGKSNMSLVTTTKFSNADEAIINQNYCQCDIDIDHQYASVHCIYGSRFAYFMFSSSPLFLQFTFCASHIIPENIKDKVQLVSVTHTVITTHHEPCGEHPNEQRSQGCFIK